MKLSEEKRQERIDAFESILEDKRITLGKLEKYIGISASNLSSYKTGRLTITDHVWELIQEGTKAILEGKEPPTKSELIEKKKLNKKPETSAHKLTKRVIKVEPLPKFEKGSEVYSEERIAEAKKYVEVAKWPYVLQQIELNKNVMIKKNLVKDVPRFLKELSICGYDCDYHLDIDGDYIFTDRAYFKTLDVEVKPIKERVKSVDEIQRLIENRTRTAKNQVVIEVPEKEEVELETELDELVQGEVVTDQEVEEKLKEIFEKEVLPTIDLSEKPSEVELIEFMKKHFSQDEYRGMLRGLSIMSIFEGRLKLALTCVNYFIENEGEHHEQSTAQYTSLQSETV